jgi:hypothetical protein
MRLRLGGAALSTALIVLAAAMPGEATRGPSLGATCAARWKGVRPLGIPGLFLTDVEAVSPTLAWAVGSFWGDAPPEILRWDGTAWTRERVHVPQGQWFGGVTATSATDAWALGYTNTITPLAVHWDGTAWTVVPTPEPGSYHYMYDIDGAAPNDVWAVGNYSDSRGYIHPMALHWDGAAWTVAEVPEAPGGNNIFYAVHAVATTDVWAVGIKGSGPFQFQPLIEHWDGTAWTVVPVAPLPGDSDQLYGVSGSGPDDAWAVGFYGDPVTPLIEHWDGTAWTQVDGPALPDRNQLFDVAAISPDDAWAVGVRSADQEAFALHWDGARWDFVAVPHHTDTQVSVTSVSASSRDDVWMAGVYLPPGSTEYPFTIHTTGCR